VNGETWLWPVDALDECFDPQHGHAAGFEAAYDSTNHNFDNACNVTPTVPEGCTYSAGIYPNYTYVENYSAGNGYNILDPYFEIAENYGFANYMFQTNQGPSFLAHQFLFSGTSAPGTYGPTQASHNLWEEFAVENPTNSGSPTHDAGCFSPSATKVYDIDSSASDTEGYLYNPEVADPPPHPGFPCYDHPSLANLLDAASYSWKYYTNSGTDHVDLPPTNRREECMILRKEGVGDDEGKAQRSGDDWSTEASGGGANGGGCGS
jgi:hypothetical protein